MEEINFEKDVEIDESALDVEWLEQPSLMAKYGKLAAVLRRKMDLAKERLDVVVAQLDRDIRGNPEQFGIAKITESALQNVIVLQEVYIKANKEYIDARYEFEMAQAALRALEQKKSALENLVKLLGMSYFAGPAVPRDLGYEMEKRREEEQKKINKIIAGKKNNKGDANV